MSLKIKRNVTILYSFFYRHHTDYMSNNDQFNGAEGASSFFHHQLKDLAGDPPAIRPARIGAWTDANNWQPHVQTVALYGNSGMGPLGRFPEWRSIPPYSGKVDFGSEFTFSLQGLRASAVMDPILELTLNHITGTGAAPVDQINRISLRAATGLTATPQPLVSGTYTLHFRKSSTAPLAFNASLALINTALAGLASTRNIEGVSRNDGVITATGGATGFADAAADVTFTFTNALGGQQIIEPIKLRLHNSTQENFRPTIEHRVITPGSGYFTDPSSSPPELRYSNVTDMIDTIVFRSSNGAHLLYTIKGAELSLQELITINPLLEEGRNTRVVPQSSLGSTSWLAANHPTCPKPKLFLHLIGPLSLHGLPVPLYDIDGDMEITINLRKQELCLHTNFATGLNTAVMTIPANGARLFFRLESGDKQRNAFARMVADPASDLYLLPLTAHQIHWQQERTKIVLPRGGALNKILLKQIGYYAAVIFYVLPSARSTAKDLKLYHDMSLFQIYGKDGISISGFQNTERDFLVKELMLNDWLLGSSVVQPKQPQYQRFADDKVPLKIGMYSWAEDLRGDLVNGGNSGSRYFSGQENMDITFPADIDYDVEVFVEYLQRRWYTMTPQVVAENGGAGRGTMMKRPAGGLRSFQVRF